MESIKDKNISRELVTLLRNLLVRDPAKRISIADALKSPWFKESQIEYSLKWQPYLTGDIFRRLRQVVKHSPFQSEVIKLIVKIFHDCTDMTVRARIFGLIDYYNNGCVNKAELKQSFEDHGIKIDE